jgi:hypothetical protein
MEAWREAEKREMEAREVEYMARMEAIEAKYRARRREIDANLQERLANIEATFKKEGTKEQQQPLDGRLGHIEKGEGDAKPAANDAPTLSSRDIQEEVIQNGSEQIVDGEIKTAAQMPEAEKPQEVPERATDEESSGGTEDRAGELRLAVRRHRQRKIWAQVNGEPRQKFAATCGRFTRRTVPALLKGHVRKGPRRNHRSGVRGPGKTFRSRMGSRSLKQRQIKGNVARETPEGRTDEKRRWTCPECNSGNRKLNRVSRTGKRGRIMKRDQRLEAERTIHIRMMSSLVTKAFAV